MTDSPDELLPPPSAELVIFGVHHSALMEVLEALEDGTVKPRGFRKAYLLAMERRWDITEASLGVIRLRSAKQDKAVAEAFHKAREWWRRSLAANLIGDGLNGRK